MNRKRADAREKTNKMKKILGICLSLLMLLPSMAADASNVTAVKEITGFEAFDINENALNLMIEYKPALEELCEMMPETLGVYLNGGSQVEYIDVEWFCVGEDYENSEHFYFQFSPAWNEEKYVLSEEIQLLTEAPYIAVFFRTEQEQISTYAVTANSYETVIFEYLTETLGYNTAAACGAMANIFCESSFIPNNLQDSYEKKLGFNNASYTLAVDNGTYKNFVRDSAGYGLCQWTYYSRKQGMLDLAKSMNVSIGDAKMQLKFLGQELKVCATGRYMKAIEDTAQGAYDVGYYYCSKFENPAQKEDEVSIYRGNLAKNTYWEEYGKNKTEPVTNVFSDVEKGQWYVEAVQYVYDSGLMSGSNGLFKPTGDVTRAQLVATLYNIEGKPEVKDFSACSNLKDVKKEQWYTNAVCWAYNTGVAAGNNSTKMFHLNDPVTRQQLATFFYNYAEYKGLDTTVSADISGMLNANQVASYAQKAVKWVVGTGLISGSKTTNAAGQMVYDLKPAGTATRAQLASILQNFCEGK